MAHTIGDGGTGPAAVTQKRSGARDVTVIREMMANTARATAVAITVTAFACCCAFAAGQDDASASFMLSDDMSADELNAMPPAASPMDAVFSMTAGLSPSPVRRPSGGTNIQKVYRTAKAMTGHPAVLSANALVAGDDTALAAGNDTAVLATFPSDLEWLLNVYNPHRWNPVMLPAASKLSVQCRDVMKVYLEALRKGSFWAAKSEL